MYSVIVMAALTAGVNAPDCHFASKGCYGGGCYGGCYGGGYGGCYGSGYGCGGCYGGGFGGCHGSGYGYGGCYGSGYGASCYGSWTCHGCYSAGYGVYGTSGYGCGGCYGSGYGAPVYAAPVQVVPATVVPATPVVPEKKDSHLQQEKARVIVELPAGAKLYVDDQLSKSTAERRVFSTPALEKGQQFYYILKAELEVDGKTYTDTRKVVVSAGAEVVAKFTEVDFKAAPTPVAGR